MRAYSAPSLSVLRAFGAVAECGSMTMAAASLSRSQPALTLSITKLESQLDAQLITRGRSGSHLTSAGRFLHIRLLRMLEQLDAALGEALNGEPSRRSNLKDKISEAQLRCMAALADRQTLELAAQSLGVMQASLRRTAQSIELLTGRPLFSVTANGVVPTKTGAELARKVKLALGEIDAAREEIAIARGRARSRVAIGVVPLCATRVFALTANDFLEAFPEASIGIVHGAYEPLLQDLRAGRIDMLYGVLRLPAWVTDVDEEPLFYDPYAVAVRRGHPLTKLKKPTLENLTAFDWIAPPHGAPRRSSIERLFAGSARKPTIRIETSSLNMQRALLSTSDRVTMLTRQEMSQEASIGSLVSLPIEPTVGRFHDGIAFRKDWRPTPVQSRFMELMRVRSAEVPQELRTMHE